MESEKEKLIDKFRRGLNDSQVNLDIKMRLYNIFESGQLEDKDIHTLFKSAYYYKDLPKLSLVLEYVDIELFRKLHKFVFNSTSEMTLAFNKHVEEMKKRYNINIPNEKNKKIDKPRAKILLEKLKELKGL